MMGSQPMGYYISARVYILSIPEAELGIRTGVAEVDMKIIN